MILVDDDDDSAPWQTFYAPVVNWTSMSDGRQLFAFSNTTRSHALDLVNKNAPFYYDGVTVGNDLFDVEPIAGGSSEEANFMTGYDNETNNLTSGDSFSSPYLMPWPQRFSWIAIFTLLVVVAAVGNALVAWIVFGESTRICLHDFVIYYRTRELER